MSYIDKDRYSLYSGEDPPEDFDQLADLADQAVDRVTLYQLRGRDISALPQLVQVDIMRAAALQIQYLNNQGGIAAINDGSTQSMALGKFSYSGDVGNGTSGGGTAWISPILPDMLAFVCAYLRGLPK